MHLYSIVNADDYFQVPYYLLNPEAVFPEAFRYVNLPTFKYIVGAGALTGSLDKEFRFVERNCFSSIQESLHRYWAHYYHCHVFSTLLLLMD
jgi:translation initiation factor 2 beta subunit (eIF-2beta)/eIF-5